MDIGHVTRQIILIYKYYLLYISILFGWDLKLWKGFKLHQADLKMKSKKVSFSILV